MCVRVCMRVCVHVCVMDRACEVGPGWGWKVAEFLLSVAVRKWRVISSISPEVLQFQTCYKWETEKAPGSERAGRPHRPGSHT